MFFHTEILKILDYTSKILNKRYINVILIVCMLETELGVKSH